MTSEPHDIIVMCPGGWQQCQELLFNTFLAADNYQLSHRVKLEHHNNTERSLWHLML